MPNTTESKPPKAAMAIAGELRRRIATGELRPGDALPTEADLTEELGYSRPTVREALRILEHEGLIRVKRGLHGGPEVRELSIAKVAQPMGVYLQISDVPVLDVWCARDRIVGAAVERLATMHGTDLSRLEHEVGELAAHIGDVATYYIHMISTAETAVALAGSATDHLVVVALRHVIALELAAASAAVTDIDVAVAAEIDIADAWRRVLEHVRAGRRRAARAAYDEQARLLQFHLEAFADGVTVGDAVSAPPAQRVDAHARRMAEAALALGDAGAASAAS